MKKIMSVHLIFPPRKMLLFVVFVYCVSYQILCTTCLFTAQCLHKTTSKHTTPVGIPFQGTSHVCMCMCMCLCVCVCVCVYVHVHTRVHVCLCACMCMCVDVWMFRKICKVFLKCFSFGALSCWHQNHDTYKCFTGHLVCHQTNCTKAIMTF